VQPSLEQPLAIFSVQDHAASSLGSMGGGTNACSKTNQSSRPTNNFGIAPPTSTTSSLISRTFPTSPKAAAVSDIGAIRAAADADVSGSTLFEGYGGDGKADRCFVLKMEPGILLRQNGVTGVALGQAATRLSQIMSGDGKTDVAVLSRQDLIF